MVSCDARARKVTTLDHRERAPLAMKPDAFIENGAGISVALLTQIESATYGRAAILVGVGVALWIVNWLILRRQAAVAT